MNIKRSPHALANSVRMKRSQDSRTVLILEGTTDQRVFGRFIDKDKCKCVVAHGKDNALCVLKELEKDTEFNGFLGIVDNDFSNLDGDEFNYKNLFFTDTHDLETMIISSEALEIVLSEFGVEEDLKKIYPNVRERILWSALPIGYLRWFSSQKKENLNLNFQNLPYKEIIDKSNLEANIDILVQLVIKNSVCSNIIDETQLKKEIKESVKNSIHNPWHVCCGHDLVNILSIGLANMPRIMYTVFY